MKFSDGMIKKMGSIVDSNDLVKSLRLMFLKDLEKYIIKFDTVQKMMRSVCPSGFIEITDETFCTCDLDSFKKFLDIFPYKYRKYVREYNDCDDYARLFYAFGRNIFPRLPIGLCHVDTSEGKHAINFVIVKKNSRDYALLLIEPQLNVFCDDKKYKPYMMVL